jgi:uncharacterized damage-inducible protein DinB
MHSKDFLRQFTYDDWANRQCIAAIRTAHSNSAGATSPATNSHIAPIAQKSNDSGLARMAHILSAQKLWLERIQLQPQSLPVWPEFTLDECVSVADEMSVAWRTLLERIGNQFAPGSLEDEVKYRNSKGESFTGRIEDILTHVLFHSAYHRGQIALELRSGGAEPAYTDFIHAVRKGFVD